MEELPGKPWTGEGVSGVDATDEEKAKIWTSLATILAELAKHPFPAAGSLSCRSSNTEVAAVASDRFVALTPDGPFESSFDYYTAFVEQYLALIADGQFYTEYLVDAYLVYRFLKDHAGQLVDPDTDGENSEQFFLKHVDDKGDHLLVDKDLNIKGIIDWQMARVVPRREAFGLSLVTADMSSLCRGNASLSVDDVALADALKKGRAPKLARYMADEKVRRFFWDLALEPKWSYALPLATAILTVFGVDQEWNQWRETALVDYKADARLQALVQRLSAESCSC